jgi:hypothetical protein
MQTDDYIAIQGKLTIELRFPSTSLLQMGVMGIHFHQLLNQTALAVIRDADDPQSNEGGEPLLKYVPHTMDGEDALIDAGIVELKKGSLIVEIEAAVAPVFNNPHSVAVLEGLTANAIWVIAMHASRIGGVAIRMMHDATEKLIKIGDRKRRTLNSSAKLRSTVEKLLLALKDSSNGGRVHLKSGDIEIDIEFYPTDRRSSRDVADE